MRGISKFVSRTKTSLLQATGNLDRTVDRNFEDEAARLKIIEPIALKLRADVRGNCESLRAVTISMSAAACALELFVDAVDDLSPSIVMLRRSMDKLDAELRPVLDSVYRVSVQEPVEKFAGKFAIYNDFIAKRKNKLLDLDSARSKVRKFAEKPSNDTTDSRKADAELLLAQQQYNAVNEALIEELPKFVGLRTTYLNTVVESFIHIQNAASEAMHSSSAEAGMKLGALGIQLTLPSVSQAVQATHSSLSKIRALSICC